MTAHPSAHSLGGRRRPEPRCLLHSHRTRTRHTGLLCAGVGPATPHTVCLALRGSAFTCCSAHRTVRFRASHGCSHRGRRRPTCSHPRPALCSAPDLGQPSVTDSRPESPSVFTPVDRCGSFAECASRSTLIRRAGLPGFSFPFLAFTLACPSLPVPPCYALRACGAVGGYARTRRLARFAGIHSASPSCGGRYGSSGASSAFVKTNAKWRFRV